MCAISGIISKIDKTVSEETLKAMSDRMILRGPDESGLYDNDKIGLAHRRLAIIDTATGQQPMSINNGDYVIVYNGEVYNFREIRFLLENKGCKFFTESDTEVVINAYIYYGIEKCLDLLEGMYAFAIYDKKIDKVFIVRDKLGEKPLYYYQDEDYFYFASELKAFKPSLMKFSIDKTALNLFLSIAYIPAPRTIFNEIKKLEQGHYLEIDSKRHIYNHLYYDVASIELKDPCDDYETATTKIRTMVEDAVRKRMVSDVPIGAFLSGGIDSSVVCAVMSKYSDQPINTFSIGFEQKEYDETERAKMLAKHIGANHTQYTLRYDDVLNILDDILLYYDEPYGGSSAIAAYYVAQIAAQKVKVVLTGDCADELMGGYEKYLGAYYTTRYKKIPAILRTPFEFFVTHIPANSYTNNFLRKANKVIRYSKDIGFDLYYDFLCVAYTDSERSRLLKTSNYIEIKPYYKELYDRFNPNLTFLQKQQLMDVGRVLEGQMFVKVDRACMHCSLENRAPFIDSKIMNYALSMNDEYKIKGRNKKRILKDAFRDLLPEDTLKFSKRGFRVPVDYWLRNELKEELLVLCSKDFIEKQGLFEYEYIKGVIDAHISQKENNRNKLWNLYVFQKWYVNAIQV